MEEMEWQNREIPGERKYKLFETSLCTHYANIVKGCLKRLVVCTIFVS